MPRPVASPCLIPCRTCAAWAGFAASPIDVCGQGFAASADLVAELEAVDDLDVLRQRVIALVRPE